MSSRCFFKKQTKPKGKAFIVITVSSCHDREGRPIKKGWSDGSDGEGLRTVQREGWCPVLCQRGPVVETRDSSKLSSSLLCVLFLLPVLLFFLPSVGPVFLNFSGVY